MQLSQTHLYVIEKLNNIQVHRFSTGNQGHKQL